MRRGLIAAALVFGIGLPTALTAAVFGLHWSALLAFWLAWQAFPFLLILGSLLTRRIAPTYAAVAAAVAVLGLVFAYALIAGDPLGALVGIPLTFLIPVSVIAVLAIGAARAEAD